MSATVLEFETALAHLKDGGGGIEPIIPERKDWGRGGDGIGEGGVRPLEISVSFPLPVW